MSRFCKLTITRFVDVALRAASILKNRDLLFLFNFLYIAKLLYLLGCEPRSMLEVLVLKNAAECTSQRLKWTSGARVVNLAVNALDLTLTNG